MSDLFGDLSVRERMFVIVEPLFPIPSGNYDVSFVLYFFLSLGKIVACGIFSDLHVTPNGQMLFFLQL